MAERKELWPRSMKYDSNEAFAAYTVTRAQIAEMLNEEYESLQLTPDDARLTNVICETFAKGIGGYIGRFVSDEMMGMNSWPGVLKVYELVYSKIRGVK